MKRRTVLATTATGLAIVSGCLGTDSSSPQQTTDTDDEQSPSSSNQNANSDAEQSTGGYEPGSAIDPNAAASSAGLAKGPDPATVSDTDPTDATAFERNPYKGYDVPLVPANTARYWYHNEQARFIDARPNRSYEASHIPGALSSPAGGTDRGVDEIEQWDESARIVTYCGCPHHLSSHRAMELYQDGYTAVFAIDEGFGVWSERGYATTGADSSLARSWHIDGQLPSKYAGEIATVKRPGNEQLLYAKPIAEDGTFSLTVNAIDVDEETVVVVQTPAGSRQATVETLARGTVTA
jgi:rhodanese-related sulfurtransferase